MSGNTSARMTVFAVTLLEKKSSIWNASFRDQHKINENNQCGEQRWLLFLSFYSYFSFFSLFPLHVYHFYIHKAPLRSSSSPSMASVDVQTISTFPLSSAHFWSCPPWSLPVNISAFWLCLFYMTLCLSDGDRLHASFTFILTNQNTVELQNNRPEVMI